MSAIQNKADALCSADRSREHREQIDDYPCSRCFLTACLSMHFVMWHDMGGPNEPPGEWRCSCGLKFGFSDTAIAHQAASVMQTLSDGEESAS